MKVFEIIKEAVSSVLFHVIDFPGAESMLKQDKFKQKDVSFTRSLTGEYHLGNKIIGVVFQFDGDLLNRKYKGGPVGTEDWDLDDNKTMRGKENKQLEDRLHTNDGIAGVSKYIKNAIIFCPKEFVENESEDGFGVSYRDSVKRIPTIIKQLTKKKIPFRYVSTVKELFNKNVNNQQGFAEAVALVDREIAGKLGLDISKNFGIEITVYTKLQQGEIDDYTGEDISPIGKDIEIVASTADEAFEKAKDKVKKWNKGMTYANLKKPGDAYAEIFYIVDYDDHRRYEVDIRTNTLTGA